MRSAPNESFLTILEPDLVLRFHGIINVNGGISGMVLLNTSEAVSALVRGVYLWTRVEEFP